MPEPFVPDEEEETDDTADVSDSDLVAAAEAAIKGDAEKTDAEKERDEQGRFIKQEQQKPKAKEAAAPPEKPSSRIAAELAKREAARAEESQYKTKLAEVDQAFNQIRQMQAQLQTQAADLARREKSLSEAERDPGAFLKHKGWTADQFIENAVRSKDPGYQEAVALREEIAKRDSVISQTNARLAALEEKARSYDEIGQKNKQAAEVREFWESIPKDSPVWQDHDDQDEILYRGKKVRQAYFDKTGKVASPKEVGEYLHYKALEKRAKPSGETPGEKPIAGRTKAKVPRALGGSDASERRPGNGVKHIHDMTPAEERDYLVDVASNAVAGGGD